MRERVGVRGNVTRGTNEPGHARVARRLRRNETDAEQIVWSWLRNRQVNGVKFRRQQAMGNYIVDFVSFERRIVIEIDGGEHSEAWRADRDRERTSWLESQGFQVIRFWNSDVRSNMNGVYLCIVEALR